MKSEVYSWRVSPETKMALELEARQAGMTVAALLDRMAKEWLRARRPPDNHEQEALHAAAAELIGSIPSGQSNRSQNARELVRNRLRRKHGR